MYKLIFDINILLSLTLKDLHKWYLTSSQNLPKLVFFSLLAEIFHGVLQVESGNQPFTGTVEASGGSTYFGDEDLRLIAI